jgi:hypothetical protein
MTERIVVGVDDSAGGWAALEYAVRERRSGAPRSTSSPRSRCPSSGRVRPCPAVHGTRSRHQPRGSDETRDARRLRPVHRVDDATGSPTRRSSALGRTTVTGHAARNSFRPSPAACWRTRPDPDDRSPTWRRRPTPRPTRPPGVLGVVVDRDDVQRAPRRSRSASAKSRASRDSGEPSTPTTISPIRSGVRARFRRASGPASNVTVVEGPE